ncbi:hypothetical protein, partial [Pseudothauera lacus]
PRYEGEPTMLWALFYPDGEVEVLASAVDPGHPQWAGRERGWPVPSQAYRLKMWERDMEELRAEIEIFENAALHRTPEQLVSEWEGDSSRRPQEIKDFTGPDDPRYLEYRKQRYRTAAQNVRDRAATLERNKP